MSHTQHDEDGMTQRQALKFAGGTVVAGAGAVAGLSGLGAQRASAQTVTDFQDLDATFAPDERATELRIFSRAFAIEAYYQ